jgi:hypothetical protein
MRKTPFFNGVFVNGSGMNHVLDPLQPTTSYAPLLTEASFFLAQWPRIRRGLIFSIFLLHQQIPVRLGKVSVRTLRTTTAFESKEGTSWSGMAVAAAVAATGLLGGATTIAVCEHVRDPKTYFCKDYKDVVEIVKDPKTSYALYASKMEIQEDRKARMQATSPSEPTPAEMPSFAADQSTMTAEEARIEEATRKAKQHSGGLKIFSGNGNMPLAMEITRYLGINLGKATVGRFADGEVNVQINENVRGKDVYIIQPTCPPVNDNMMELLLMISTLRRASARRITVVIPYYGYARQDRKMQVCRVFALSNCRNLFSVLT